MGRAVMVQGTSSSAGKSLLATALCAHAARAGVRVAPFKAQNMSNNARVVDGGEIGTAQAVQAWACGLRPDVRMNPVLVKPEGDTRSQVIVRGRVDHALSRLAWEDRVAALWHDIRTCLHDLLDDHDLVVIEGAGSPAEFNLWPYDLANMRVAAEAAAPVLLVSDIDRGGALAHCYGTWAVLPAGERARIRAFVLNKFRGDPALLRPGLDGLRARTGVPVAGVLPWLDHGLPDEDAARGWDSVPAADDPIVVVAYPTISNLDEFAALARVVPVRWARSADRLRGARMIVLPGAKHVAASRDWLRTTGLDTAIVDAAAAGVPIMGICGGMQLLGDRIDDPFGVDGSREGLGLLPVRTTFARDKLTATTHVTFADLDGPWTAWSGRTVNGYEIRHGTTAPTGDVAAALAGGRGFVRGNVLGVSVHGIWEDPELVRALLGGERLPLLDDVFTVLADAVAIHLDPSILDPILEGTANMSPRSPAPARDQTSDSASDRSQDQTSDSASDRSQDQTSDSASGTAHDPSVPPTEAPQQAERAWAPSLLLVNTGDGKGKTTAALGTLLRSVARGWRVCVVQFMKSGEWKVGEEESARRLGIEWWTIGDGFTWESEDLDESQAVAIEAWRHARKIIDSGDYQMVMLDEVTYPINFGWIDVDEVVATLRDRPEQTTVIVTGRDAPPEIIAIADTVTEMRKVKHAFDRGIQARRGIDY